VRDEISAFVLVLGGCVLVGLLLTPWVLSQVGSQLEKFGESQHQDMTRTTDAAKAFAATHSQKECASAALEHVKDCDSLLCKPFGAMFVSLCLDQAAERSPELCREIPEFWVSRWLWPRRQCAESDVDPQACGMIYSMVSDYCARAQSRARASR